MLVVLASPYDDAAGALIAAWPGEARRLGLEDLSRPGWIYFPGAGAGAGIAAVGGERVPSEAITAVVTRLPYVAPGALAVIAEQDRAYVAAEMTAFLTAWLSELPCPVLNRPSPGELMGPAWSTERWLLRAHALGIPAVAVRQSIGGASDGEDAPGAGGSEDAPGAGRSEDAADVGRDKHSAGAEAATATLTVSIVGGRVVGCSGPECRGLAGAAEAALTLAAAAGVDLLRAHFSVQAGRAAFAAADYWVDVGDPAAVNALSERLREPATR